VPLSGVVLAEGLGAHPEGMIPVAGALLTCCHLLPAVLWAGMLVYTARTAIAWRAGPAAARGLFRLYGTAAAWLFGIVVLTGVLSAVLLVPVSSLLTTTYGRFLVAKAALVAVAAALALASRAGLRRPAPPGTALPLAVRLEIGALAAVLAVTGLLTVLTPRRSPSSHWPPPYRRPAKYRDQADNMRAPAPAMSQPILARILLTIANPPIVNLIRGPRSDAIPVARRCSFPACYIATPWRHRHGY
jgi:copper transport protein